MPALQILFLKYHIKDGNNSSERIKWWCSRTYFFRQRKWLLCLSKNAMSFTMVTSAFAWTPKGNRFGFYKAICQGSDSRLYFILWRRWVYLRYAATFASSHFKRHNSIVRNPGMCGFVLSFPLQRAPFSCTIVTLSGCQDYRIKLIEYSSPFFSGHLETSRYFPKLQHSREPREVNYSVVHCFLLFFHRHYSFQSFHFHIFLPLRIKPLGFSSDKQMHSFLYNE